MQQFLVSNQIHVIISYLIYYIPSPPLFAAFNFPQPEVAKDCLLRTFKSAPIWLSVRTRSQKSSWARLTITKWRLKFHFVQSNDKPPKATGSRNCLSRSFSSEFAFFRPILRRPVSTWNTATGKYTVRCMSHRDRELELRIRFDSEEHYSGLSPGTLLAN